MVYPNEQEQEASGASPRLAREDQWIHKMEQQGPGHRLLLVTQWISLYENIQNASYKNRPCVWQILHVSAHYVLFFIRWTMLYGLAHKLLRTVCGCRLNHNPHRDGCWCGIFYKIVLVGESLMDLASSILSDALLAGLIAALTWTYVMATPGGGYLSHSWPQVTGSGTGNSSPLNTYCRPESDAQTRTCFLLFLLRRGTDDWRW